MPARNAERFIGAAIGSILGQSHQNLRLFVVDDASEDATGAIVAGFARRDPRVTVLESEGRGIVAALTTGIANGSAPLIARMDADDVSLPRRLELQSKFLTDHPGVALVGGSANVVDGSGRILRQLTYPTHAHEIEARVLTEVCFASATMLIRREALADVGGFRAMHEAEDADLALRLAERYPLANLADVILCYRVHTGNVTGSRLRRQSQSVIVARAEALARRRGSTPAAHSLDELQSALGIAQHHVERYAFRMALIWSELLAEAGLIENSEETLQEAAVLASASIPDDEADARIEATRRRITTINGHRPDNPVLQPARRAIGRVPFYPNVVEAGRLAKLSMALLVREGPTSLVHAMQGWKRNRRHSELEDSCTRRPPMRGQRVTVGDPLVSVIVRTRNRPGDLRLALNSLAWQTLDSFEVVVVNDGGDDVEQLLADYRASIRVRYVFNERSHGRTAAANDGVEAALGRYVTFLDDDDIVYPFHLASLVRRSEQFRGEQLIYSHYDLALVRGRGETASVIDRVYPPPWKFDRSELLVHDRPPIHTWLVPRTLFSSYGGFDPAFTMVKDWEFLLRVTEMNRLIPLQRATCQYRIYLDLQNSVVGDRSRMLGEVRDVHKRHASHAETVEQERGRFVAALESQITLAEDLRAGVQLGTMTQDEAALRYASAVFGFTVHA